MTITSSDKRFATNHGPAAAGSTGGKNAVPATTETAVPKKSPLKSKKFIMIVVLVLAVGGGAYKFLMPQKAVPPAPGDVISMDATTLNLAGGHYLKIALSIELVKGKASATSFFTSQASELMIDEFSNRTVASLSSNAARQKALTDLLGKVKVAYPGEVYDVFITQFVTQ
jgi:flagellar protein FliL